MRKNTKKSAAGRKPKQTYVPLSSCALREKMKTKNIFKKQKEQRHQIHLPSISKLLNEEILSCSICLQLLLCPVLAQCGHTFCLHCSEDLAKNGFACGICHTHLPSYDLQHSHIIENLVNDFLASQKTQERQNYLKRTQEMESKQGARRIKDIQEGNIVDFWCEEELAWKSGTITEKKKNGSVILTSNKNTKYVSIHIDSRRLAPHRTFTKEDPVSEIPQVQFRAINMGANPQFDPLRMPMPQRPYIFGMPLFLGYYWGDGNRQFRGEGDAIQQDNHFTF